MHHSSGLIRVLAVVGLSGSLTVSFAGSAWDPKSEVKAIPEEMTVYRSPSCGCCGQWLEHMRKSGFKIRDLPTEDMDSIKKRYGVPGELQSCHTAVIGNYVVEGHVPAQDVRELLKRHPKATGLTVPGMPSGTPGMEMGGRKDPFAVVEFSKDGASHPVREYHDY